MFNIGDAVVCIDASDIPSPPWKPLKCGGMYTIRSIDIITELDGNYDKNIHKKARFVVRLWGITNPMHPVYGKELGYADSRFEKIQPNVQSIRVKDKIAI